MDDGVRIFEQDGGRYFEDPLNPPKGMVPIGVLGGSSSAEALAEARKCYMSEAMQFDQKLDASIKSAFYTNTGSKISFVFTPDGQRALERQALQQATEAAAQLAAKAMRHRALGLFLGHAGDAPRVPRLPVSEQLRSALEYADVWDRLSQRDEGPPAGDPSS